MLVFAHRGASGYAPENTLAAFKKAVALGSRAIEVDIHSIEGELYTYHDRRLESKSDGNGVIDKVSRAYLDTLTINGEPIPTLWQVMQYLSNTDCLVNIELKGINCLAPFLAMYPRLINELGYTQQRLLISAFHHGFLAQFSLHFPTARVAPLLAGVPLSNTQVACQLNAYSIHFSLNYICQELVNEAHNNGIKIFVYTVDYQDDIQMLYHMGVDGIFSNYPDIAAESIAKLNGRKP